MTTEPTDKLRAVILTAIMVLSVFGGTIAFAGSAAAGGGGPTQEEATEFTPANSGIFGLIDGSLDGTHTPHDVTGGSPDTAANVDNVSSVIVVTFNESVESAAANEGLGLNISANGQAGTDTNRNITVYVDNRNVTNKFFLEDDGGSSGDGQGGAIVLFSEALNLNGTSDVKVHINNVSTEALDATDETVDRTSAPGNISVTVTTATVDTNGVEQHPATGSGGGSPTKTLTGVYEGAVVAINFDNASRTGTNSVASTDPSYEYYIDDTFDAARSAGVNDRLVTFDTDGVDRQALHEWRLDYDGDGSYDATTSVGENATEITDIRVLNLEASADSTDLTTSDSTIDATISAAASGRTVDYRLEFVDNGTVVSKNSKSIPADGSLEVSFTNPGKGDYWINATDVGTGVTTATSQITVEKVTGEASFQESVYSEEEGDIVNISVDVSNSDTAQVVIGSAGVNYVREVDIEDGDGDDTVYVRWNTYDDTVSTNQADDSVSFDTSPDLITQTTASPPLDADSYDLNVSIGSTEKGVSTVELTERSLTSVTARAAATGADTGTRAEILDNSKVDSKSAIKDKFILEVEASGIYGFFDSSYALNQTANEPGSGNSNNANNASQYGLYMTIDQTNSGANQAPNRINATNVSLVIDEANNTFYAVIDSSNNAASEAFAGMAKDQKYEATLVLNETSPYVKDSTTAEDKEEISTTFETQERKIEIDNLNASDALNVNPQDNVSVSGTTNLADGTNFTVTVRSGGNYLLQNTDVPVEDGAWSTEFDFSDKAGTDFTITVKDSSASRQRSGMVFEAASSSVTFNDQESPGGASVVVKSATMSRGGFIAIHSGSASGPIIGSSKFLSAGTHTNVRIALDETLNESTTLVAMTHLDEDGSETFNAMTDGAYKVNGSAVTDSASVSPAEAQTVTRTVQPKTPTPIIVTKASPTPKPPQVTERTVEKTVVVTKTASPGQPGFGVAIAVVALLAAALLAVRRRD